MTKELLENYIRNLKKDIKIIAKNKYHPRTTDLMRMVLEEDIIEIIKFLEHMNKVLDYKTPEVSGQYSKGYISGMIQLKREIYETK